MPLMVTRPAVEAVDRHRCRTTIPICTAAAAFTNEAVEALLLARAEVHDRAIRSEYPTGDAFVASCEAVRPASWYTVAVMTCGALIGLTASEGVITILASTKPLGRGATSTGFRNGRCHRVGIAG